MSDRIIIADDHPLFRDALRRIVQRVVVGQIIEVSDATGLFKKLEISPRPLVMFLDLVFPGFDGINSINELRQKFPQTAIVVVSMTSDNELISQILAAGANGFISKSVSLDTMMQSISRIIEGEILVCKDDLGVEPKFEQGQRDGLTQRHIDVLVRIGQGQTNKEIARELNISPFTVRAHISALFKILGVNTRSAASTLAVEQGLI